jgi:hypothetical protein
MCRFARGVAAARKVAMDMRWFKKTVLPQIFTAAEKGLGQ